MKKEVEILFELKEPIDSVVNKLGSFSQGKTEEVMDIYYYSKSNDDLKPRDFRLNSCLRLRKRGECTYFAYKKDYFDNNDIWAYSDEYEVVISDFLKMQSILEKIGFQELLIIENIKTVFTDDVFEICLEKVKDLGLFIEVEYHLYDESISIKEAKDNIRNLIKVLGINVGEELNMGKPELFLRKKTENKK